MSRITRYGLFFAPFWAVTLLTVTIRKDGADPAPSSRPFHDWDIPELAGYLHRMGVEVRLRAVPNDGPLNHSAFLTSRAKGWGELNALSKDPKRIQEWDGTLYCERVGESDTTHLLEQWGDHCLAIAPFLFYGDAELLDRVRIALAPLIHSATP